MTTVFFYNSILLGSTLFVWLSERVRTQRDRIILLTTAFLLVFIPAAIRYDIGTDFLNYLSIYESAESLERFKLKEPGFYLVNIFLKSLNAHPQWMFATFAFIFTALAFKAYPRRNAWIIHFLFFSMLWFFSFNGMRQAIAVACCFVGVFCFFKKRYLVFLLWSIIGFSFHQSVFFILILGVIAKIPLRKNIKYQLSPVMLIGMVLLTFVSMELVLNYIEQILNMFRMDKYAKYFGNEAHFRERDYGTGLGVLVKVLFSIYILWNTKIFLRLNKDLWLLILLVFFYAMGVVLANRIIIFGRMADIFVLGPVIACYVLTIIPINKKINYIVVMGFMIFLIVSFTKDGFGIETSYADPKRNPYQIFINNGYEK